MSTVTKEQIKAALSAMPVMQIAELVKEMNEGKVGALIMYRTNPVYSAESMKFKNVSKSRWFNSMLFMFLISFN